MKDNNEKKEDLRGRALKAKDLVGYDKGAVVSRTIIQKPVGKTKRAEHLFRLSSWFWSTYALGHAMGEPPMSYFPRGKPGLILIS